MEASLFVRKEIELGLHPFVFHSSSQFVATRNPAGFVANSSRGSIFSFLNVTLYMPALLAQIAIR